MDENKQDKKDIDKSLYDTLLEKLQAQDKALEGLQTQLNSYKEFTKSLLNTKEVNVASTSPNHEQLHDKLMKGLKR